MTNYLSENACKNSDAIYFKDRRDTNISPYFNDCSLIVNSNSYTRLMDKTQVFSHFSNDHITTRMVHVQLVSRIAREIGRELGLNEDLIEAMALGHDIGHTPFGHQGEEILSDISVKNGEGYFAHNVQSVRNLLYLENHGEGLNVSLQTVDGILCHNGELIQGKCTPSPKTVGEFLEQYNDCYNDKAALKKLKSMTLEGCVVRMSDSIAYLGRDLDDAKRYGVFSWDDMPKDITRVLGRSKEEFVGLLIRDIIKNSYGESYIMMSSEYSEAMNEWYKIVLPNVYTCKKKMDDIAHLPDMMNGLFEMYMEALKQDDRESSVVGYFHSMNDDYKSNTTMARVVIDYIAGMTNRFLEEEFKKEQVRVRKL